MVFEGASETLKSQISQFRLKYLGKHDAKVYRHGYGYHFVS